MPDGLLFHLQQPSFCTHAHRKTSYIIYLILLFLVSTMIPRYGMNMTRAWILYMKFMYQIDMDPLHFEVLFIIAYQ